MSDAVPTAAAAAAPAAVAEISRGKAWACLLSNAFFLPGAGSLIAGRKLSGWVQLVFSLVGLALSALVIFPLMDFFRDYMQLLDTAGHSTDVALFSTFKDRMWGHLRSWSKWVGTGFGLFTLSWLWAIGTSISVFRSAR
ncbi:MAG: hypothetical protein EXS24_00605 [Pedosphaera sp.]|nr:hypothetical protein [Pedosphaera sp.]